MVKRELLFLSRLYQIFKDCCLYYGRCSLTFRVAEKPSCMSYEEKNI